MKRDSGRGRVEDADVVGEDGARRQDADVVDEGT